MTIRPIPRRSTRYLIGVTFGLAAMLAGSSVARGDTFRIKTGRGTFLVEVNVPDVRVRGDGDDLVVTRSGDEIRLRLDVDRANRSGKEPALLIEKDGKTIVSARRISSGPASPFVDAPGRTVLGSGSLGSAWSLALTPDGKTLVSGHGGSLRVWDLPDLTERYKIPTADTVRRVAVTSDGSMIAAAEYQQGGGKTTGSLVFRDGKTGQTRHATKPIEQGLHSVTIDPEGKVAVSSCWSEPVLRVWDIEKGEQVGMLKGHTGAVGMISFSPDGKTLASGGDNTVRLWDVDTGETRKILRGHNSGIEPVNFSADGKMLASGSFDDTARVWDVATGHQLASFACGNPVLSVAFSNDGKMLASGAAKWGAGFYGASPATVQVWDVAGKKLLATLPEQPNQVFALVFTADGKSLITASLSGAVTLWDLATFLEPAAPEKTAQPEGR